MESTLNLAGALLAVVGALLGLGQYYRFRSRRERQASVGQAFKEIVAGLGSPVEVERVASAALIRRFFDDSSEYSVRGLPYAKDAVTVTSAALRSEPNGTVQKLLADGLSYAPSLVKADLQKTNLVSAYWGSDTDKTAVDARDADFFRADLSRASLRRARLTKAVFREAHLHGTVFEDADCTKANFDGSDLRGARFRGSKLTGASFHQAQHIPPAVEARLVNGVVIGEEPISGEPTAWDADSTTSVRVFLSVPSVMDANSQVALEQILSGLRHVDAEAVRYEPSEYAQSQPLLEVTRRIRECDAVLALGAPQLVIEEGYWRKGTSQERTLTRVQLPTPWNQIEAGIAMGLDKPLLIVNNGTVGGVFELPGSPLTVAQVDSTAPGELASLDRVVSQWAAEIGKHRASTPGG